jgi:hypothetical protein
MHCLLTIWCSFQILLEVLNVEINPCSIPRSCKANCKVTHILFCGTLDGTILFSSGIFVFM